MARSACLVLAVLVASPAGRADPAPADEAARLFAAGRAELIDAGDTQRACELFGKAIALDPTAAGTMLNLGLCNEKLGKLHTALVWFRKAQTRASEAGLADCEQAAREHAAKLAGEVAIVEVALAGAPAAAVTIDGGSVSPADYGHLEIDPGPHELVARARGYHTVRVRFTVTGRGGQTLAVRLVPGSDTVVIDPGRARRRGALFVAIAGGVLVAGSGIVVWDAKQSFDRNAGRAMAGDPAAEAATRHAQSLARYAGTGLFAGGVLALGAAAYLYFTAPAKIERIAPAPLIGPDRLGVALGGTF